MDWTVSVWRLLLSLFLPIYIVRHGLKKQSLSYSGAITAYFVGFFHIVSSFGFFFALLVFYLSGSRATKVKCELKKKQEKEYIEGGQRNWVQVICNGGVSSLMCFLYFIEVGSTERLIDFSTDYFSSCLIMSAIGALSCSCGDTFASEFGSVFGSSDPISIVTLKHVPRGVNGGISLIGTLASIAGGALIGIAFYLATIICFSSQQLESAPPQWPVVIVATFAGFLGSLIDSFLGATFQFSGQDLTSGHITCFPGNNVRPISGRNVIDNNIVNLFSSFLTATITPYIAFYVWAKVQ